MERGLCGSGSTGMVDMIVNSFEFRPNCHTREDNIMTITMGYLNIMSPVF